MLDYEKIISPVIQNIKPSGIRKFFDIASTMKDVISLGVGEPDFSTPWAVRRTAIQTLEREKIVYSANAGLFSLREALSEYLEERMHLSYDPADEIIATVGGSEAIDLGIRTLVCPGDEVLIVEPCFVCYAPIVQLAGGVPIPVETTMEDSFKLRPEVLRKKISPKTKLLIFPYPNNPTGAIMTQEDMEPIVKILQDTNIIVLSDEIYAELTYGGRRHISIASLPGMQERTVLIGGFSKTFAMTGWRLGFAAGPLPIMRQMLKLHQYAIMCSPTVSQYAAITALKECAGDVQKMVEEYDVRRRLLVDRLNQLGLKCFNPEGAFYVFPSIQSTGLSSEEFCNRLVKEQRVAVVPGGAFGKCGEGYVRISYAYSLKHLLEALKRIELFLQAL